MPFEHEQPDIEQAAKELWQVWADQVTDDIIAHGYLPANQTWEHIPQLHREAWIRVAKHVIQQSVELFGLMTPDHR